MLHIHMLLGLYFIHTSSVTLPATGVLPASKSFGSKIPISLYSNLPTLYFFLIQGWLPATYHGRLPCWVGPSLLLWAVYLCCCFSLLSHPSSPLLLSPDLVAAAYKLGSPPLHHCIHSLQIPGLSLHMQHRLKFIWFNPEYPQYISHCTHTHILKYW